VERLSELSGEHTGFFANPTIRDSVQGLHEYVLCLLSIYGSLTRKFGSDLEAVLRGCEAKYLRKRSLWKKVKKVLRGGDVDRDLTRVHQKIQKAYSKWTVRVVSKWWSTG